MKSLAELSNLPKAVAFLNAWIETFTGVLEKASGAKHLAELLAVESIEPAILSAAEKGVCIILSSSGALGGEQACFVSETDARILAALLVGERPDPAFPLTDADREAGAEVFRRVAAQVASDLASKWNEPVSLSFDAVRPVAWEPAAKAAIRVTTSDGKKPIIVLALHENLLAALEAAPAAASKEPTTPDPAQPAKGATSSNLDLLLDIELDVTIRFGQREMLLRDVLDLRSGSVIELERHVEEPAELLVAGRPVARGEVVVVEGNYGLRITEILSPRQRYEVVGR